MAKITKLGVGESLVGEGNEVAHIDLIIGPRGSAAETAFANALVNNKDGFTTLLAVSPRTCSTKPEHDPVQQGHDQGRQAGRPDVRPGAACGRQGRRRLASPKAYPGQEADDLFICVGVFIHWEANDDKKSTTTTIRRRRNHSRAVTGEPKASEVVAKRNGAKHPFSPEQYFRFGI